MKKSEKIEIRISRAEKESSTSFANFTICKQTLVECTYRADASLEMNHDSSPSRLANEH